MDMNEDQEASFRRSGAEFIMVDLELAFTFLDLAGTSGNAETKVRNQKNARIAYAAVLRFLPRSVAALSGAEHQGVRDKLVDLKSRLQELGEEF